MINHARTLLLNIGSNTYNADLPGEEFIPAFEPLILPDYLTRAHKILFGATPDKVFLNFRARELLSLVHQTELAEFLYALDPRITYTSGKNDDFFTPKNYTVVERTGGSEAININFAGYAKADNALGRAYLEYRLRVVNDGGQVVAQLIPVTDDTTVEEIVTWGPAPMAFTQDGAPVMRQLSGSSGVSNAIVVPKTKLSFQLSMRQMEIELLAAEDLRLFEEEQPVGAAPLALDGRTTAEALRAPVLKLLNQPSLLAEWYLKIYAKPGSAISVCLPKLELLGETTYIDLFGIDYSGEPYKTFKSIWFEHPTPAYRLAAFVVAMIYRMEEVRTNNGRNS